MADKMGKFNSFSASAYHEIVDNVRDGRQTWLDFRMDMHNNFKGIFSSKDIMDLYLQNELKVIRLNIQSGYGDKNEIECK